MFEALCDKCHKIHNYVKSVDTRNETPECCGVQTRKVILTVPMGYVQPDVCYDSPIDGRPITTRQARIEDLKRSGSRPWEGREIEQQEANRRTYYEEKADDAKLYKVIESSLMQISEDSRRTLLNA
jgi:hypothetical protein